jgi:hypothetical protein
MINFEKIPTPPQEESEELTKPDFVEKDLQKQRKRGEVMKEEVKTDDDVETEEFNNVHFEPTQIKRSEEDDIGSATTGMLSDESAIDTEDIGIPEDVRERHEKGRIIADNAVSKLKDIVSEANSERKTDGKLRDDIFSLIKDIIVELYREDLIDSVYIREMIFKGFKDVLKGQANKEFYVVSEKANLRFEDTPEKREDLNKQLYGLEKRYIHILKDIFDELNLGEAKGGHFDIER